MRPGPGGGEAAGPESGAMTSDEELRRRIEARARELWAAAGRPEGRELEHWLRAEEELAPYAVPAAGEEDPLEGLDHAAPGGPGKRGAE